jgi:hypothetical protein
MDLLDRAIYLVGAVVAPWPLMPFVWLAFRSHFRRAAARRGAAPSERGSYTRVGARVLRGSIGMGIFAGALLFAAEVAGVPAEVRAQVWLLAAGAASCVAAGIVLSAIVRGAFAVPSPRDPAYPAIASYVDALQDGREERAAQRRRAAAERRDARRRGASYSLASLVDMDGERFEQLCGDYFAALGYTVDYTPQSGDGGIDLVLTRDGELAVAQCKRTKKSVGEPVVRDLYGALHHTGAVEAFLCSASGFSPAAESWAVGKPLTLVDGREIVSTLRRRR